MPSRRSDSDLLASRTSEGGRGSGLERERGLVSLSINPAFGVGRNHRGGFGCLESLAHLREFLGRAVIQRAVGLHSR